MRIIAGSKRGMKLFTPKSYISRPVIDRVKESLFSVLYKYNLPADAVVADVFSGVGSFGLEALSRGARFATFVEKDPQTAAVLHRNIEKAMFVERSKVVQASAIRVGAPVRKGGDKHNLIFVDPPYAQTEKVGDNSPLARVMKKLEDQAAPQAIVTVRTESRVRVLAKYGPFEILERRKWGTMAVAIFRNSRKHEDPPEPVSSTSVKEQ